MLSRSAEQRLQMLLGEVEEMASLLSQATLEAAAERITSKSVRRGEGPRDGITVIVAVPSGDDMSRKACALEAVHPLVLASAPTNDLAVASESDKETGCEVELPAPIAPRQRRLCCVRQCRHFSPPVRLWADFGALMCVI